MTIHERLTDLNLTLPPPPQPVAVYRPALQTGDRVYVSGQLNLRDGALTISGRLGDGVSLEQGADAARIALLNALAALQAEIGSLDRVRRVIRLSGYVAATPEFTQHPQVINGASELLRAIFGEAGLGTRIAVGVASLPLGAPVEVELIVEVSG